MVFSFIHKVYKVRKNMKEMQIKSISLTITDNKRHQGNIDIMSFVLVSDVAILNVGEYEHIVRLAISHHLFLEF